MPLTPSAVFVGSPDQLTTGAILTGPETDTIPATIVAFTTALTGKTDSGYISEDGVTLTPDDSTESIKDWSGAEIRRILTGFTGELSWEHLDMSTAALQNYFGDAFVTTTAPTVSTGTYQKVSFGKNALPVKAWYIKMKDGNRKIGIMVPHGQIVSRGEINFVSTDAVKLPVTLACYPDAAGQSIYIFSDDGKTT